MSDLHFKSYSSFHHLWSVSRQMRQALPVPPEHLVLFKGANNVPYISDVFVCVLSCIIWGGDKTVFFAPQAIRHGEPVRKKTMNRLHTGDARMSLSLFSVSLTHQSAEGTWRAPAFTSGTPLTLHYSSYIIKKDKYLMLIFVYLLSSDVGLPWYRLK